LTQITGGVPQEEVQALRRGPNIRSAGQSSLAGRPRLQANIAAGTLRPDLNARDVILALAGLWQLDPASDWRAQAQRI